MRRVLVLLFLLVGTAFQTKLAHAGNQDFTLVNRTGYQIDEVYVSRSSARNWGHDVMGRDSLEDDHWVKITIDAPEHACRWDLKVKYSDGDEATWSDLNLCNIEKVSLYWDRKREVTRAVTE
jgi:hypothetical protein